MPIASTNPTLNAVVHAEGKPFRLADYFSSLLRVQLALAFIGLPTTLLIDRQSREIGRLQGPFAWDSDDAVEQIVGAF